MQQKYFAYIILFQIFLMTSVFKHLIQIQIFMSSFIFSTFKLKFAIIHVEAVNSVLTKSNIGSLENSMH